MAINGPIIAGEPAIERKRARRQPVPVGSAPPTETYTGIREDGNVDTLGPVTPEWEGQVYVYTFSIEGNTNAREAELYVAVDIGGTLQWKRASGFTIINGWSGRAIDPLYPN